MTKLTFLCCHSEKIEISKSKFFLVLADELLVNRLKFLYYRVHFFFFPKPLLNSFNNITYQNELKEIQS